VKTEKAAELNAKRKEGRKKKVEMGGEGRGGWEDDKDRSGVEDGRREGGRTGKTNDDK